MLDFILGIAVIVSCVLYLIIKGRWTKTNIPGPPGTILFGNTMNLSTTNMKYNLTKLESYAREYGDIFSLTIMGKQMVFLNSPDVAKKLFSQSPYCDVTNDRPPMFFSKHFYNGVESLGFHAMDAVSKGLKRGVMKGLHIYGDGVKAFEQTVRNEVCDVMKRIERHQGEEFECVGEIGRAIANIISVLLRGKPFETAADADLFQQYTYSMDTMLHPVNDGILGALPFMRFVPGYFRNICQHHRKLYDDILHKFFYSMKSTYKHGETRGLVDYLFAEQTTEIENGNGVLFTDARIQTTLMDIIAAGNVTSRSSLSGMVLCLLHHPALQDKLYTEIDGVIGRERPPTLADRPFCPLLEAFALEYQRYASISPFAIPHFCRKEFVYEGYTFPANSTVLLNAWFIHHDERTWGDPWTFRPERFLDSDGQLLEKEHSLRRQWMAFGVGKRHCLGENFARSRLFLFLASFLQRWKFLPPEGVQVDPASCDPRNDGHEVEFGIYSKPFSCRVIHRN